MSKKSSGRLPARRQTAAERRALPTKPRRKRIYKQPKAPYGPQRRDLPRIPTAFADIQSNHCRNVGCENFGVEPLPTTSRGPPRKDAVTIYDGYKMSKARMRHLSIASDRQDYIINWSDRADKRNTHLTAVGSADNFTGYVFGMRLNYDPAPDRKEVEALAIVAGDFDGRDSAFRRYARYWLEPDYVEAVANDPGQAYGSHARGHSSRAAFGRAPSSFWS